MKRLLRFCILCILLVGIVVVSVDRYVAYAVKTQMYADIRSVPGKKVGLLLGTGKYLQGGQ